MTINLGKMVLEMYMYVHVYVFGKKLSILTFSIMLYKFFTINLSSLACKPLLLAQY